MWVNQNLLQNFPITVRQKYQFMVLNLTIFLHQSLQNVLLQRAFKVSWTNLVNKIFLLDSSLCGSGTITD